MVRSLESRRHPLRSARFRKGHHHPRAPPAQSAVSALPTTQSRARPKIGLPHHHKEPPRGTPQSRGRGLGEPPLRSHLHHRRTALDEALRHSLPVVHVGQPAAVDRIASIPDARWLVVELWCPRDIAAARLVARGTVDTTQRLEVWDKTPRLINPDLVIDTSTAEPGVAARQIDNRLRDGTAPAPALDWSALGPAVGPRRHLPYLLESEVTVKRGLNRFLAVVTLRFLCAILGCEGRRFVPPETRFLPVRALGSCATSRNAAGVRVYLRGRRVVLPMRPRQVSSLSTCRGRTTDPRAVVIPSGQEEE